MIWYIFVRYQMACCLLLQILKLIITCLKSLYNSTLVQLLQMKPVKFVEICQFLCTCLVWARFVFNRLVNYKTACFKHFTTIHVVLWFIFNCFTHSIVGMKKFMINWKIIIQKIRLRKFANFRVFLLFFFWSLNNSQ